MWTIGDAPETPSSLNQPCADERRTQDADAAVLVRADHATPSPLDRPLDSSSDAVATRAARGLYAESRLSGERVNEREQGMQPLPASGRPVPRASSPMAHGVAEPVPPTR